MPRFDFKCMACGAVRPDVWVSNFRDASDSFSPANLHPCEKCAARRWEKMPAAPNFSVGGFNAKNGYSK